MTLCCLNNALRFTYIKISEYVYPFHTINFQFRLQSERVLKLIYKTASNVYMFRMQSKARGPQLFYNNE